MEAEAVVFCGLRFRDGHGAGADPATFFRYGAGFEFLGKSRPGFGIAYSIWQVRSQAEDLGAKLPALGNFSTKITHF